MAKAERVLDPAAVSNFFMAQIGANKLVRYSLLAEWRRVGKAPDHTPVNLAGVIRPELDEVEEALIAELAETVGIRASLSCRADVAKAVGKYASAHKNRLDALKAIALDRAMGAACTRGSSRFLRLPANCLVRGGGPAITACLNAHDDERHVVMLPVAIHKN